LAWFASDLTRNLDEACAACGHFLEGNSQREFEVLSGFVLAISSKQSFEHIRENLAELLRGRRAAIFSVEGPQSVIAHALIRIAEGFIGGFHLLETLGSARIVRPSVRVQFERQATVCFFDVIRGGRSF